MTAEKGVTVWMTESNRKNEQHLVEYFEGANFNWEIVALSSKKSMEEMIRESKYPCIWVYCSKCFIPPKEFEVLMSAIDEGYDLVVASRFKNGESNGQKVSIKTAFRDRISNFFQEILYHRGLKDYTSGSFLFKKELYQKIQSPKLITLGCGLPSNLLIQLSQNGTKKKEKGVMWIP